MVAMAERVDGSTRVTVAAGPFETHTDPNAVSTSRGLSIGSVATRVPTAPTSPADGLAATPAGGAEPDAFVPGAGGGPIDAAGAAQALSAMAANRDGNQARTDVRSRPRMSDIAALAQGTASAVHSIVVIKTAILAQDD